MAHPTYSGKEVQITFGSVTLRFKSFEVKVMADKRDTTPSDSAYLRRATGTLDASMTIVGYESDDTGAGNFDYVAGLVLAQTAPSALSWTDDAGTPASKLPSDFFTTHFPLADWRVDEATGGSGGPTDTAEWSVTLSPNND